MEGIENHEWGKMSSKLILKITNVYQMLTMSQFSKSHLFFLLQTYEISTLEMQGFREQETTWNFYKIFVKHGSFLKFFYKNEESLDYTSLRDCSEIDPYGHNFKR